MLFSKSAADDTQRVRVKICGITREDDVVAAVDAGTDAVGFNYALQEAYHEAKADILTSIQRGVCAHLAAAETEHSTGK